MKMRDIVNRSIVNLDNCETEPIHIPGSIQPHGFLIAVTGEGDIRYCSANTTEFVGMAPGELLQKNIKDIWGIETLAVFAGAINGDETAISLPLTIGSTDFECTVHQSGHFYIIEAEPSGSINDTRGHINLQTSRFLSYMNKTETLQELCQLVADGTRELTGYDRVMIYRFDEQYNGEIFAESCNSDLEPFLGLHYPHTDIPSQARELYMRNHIRMIADIGYTPVPIYTLADDGTETLDMSLSMLRSTSPIHVEYLQNMGVGATLTISLIHEDRLWGLIACHHYSPKKLAPEIRTAARLQGQFIASQINMRQTNEEYEVAKTANLIFERLSAIPLIPSEDSFRQIILNPELIDICNASGVSLSINGIIYKNGLVPEEQDIRLLADVLEQKAKNGLLATHEIRTVTPSFTEVCSDISGVLYHSLDNGNCIIWYRPETITEVLWGGNPEKAIIRDDNGLHPRKSFELWKEILKCQSSKWLQPEINAAANYAHILQKHIGLVRLSVEEEKYRKLSEELREANADLENINWISTHDLQEPLRKIQLMSSMLISEENSDTDIDRMATVAKINKAAKRMRTLLADILSYTRIQNDQTSFERINFKTILDEVLSDFDEKIKSSGATIKITEMPVVSGIPFLLKQLASNLVRNSLQYVHPLRPPNLTITYTLAVINNREYHQITFTDNGIGFDQEKAKGIFRIFSKLHSGNHAGSGIGLALSKKIVQLHRGSIEAYGSPGEGAAITILLPANEV